MKIFMVIAGKPQRRVTDGTVTLGLDTLVACSIAVRRARALGEKCAIIVTAGRAPKEWDNTVLSILMADYLELFEPSPQVEIVQMPAQEFTTWGEVKTLAELISTRYQQTTSVELVVKWWHAPRALLLAEFWMNRCGVGSIPIRTYECVSKVNCVALIKEFCGAWPKNVFRMIKQLTW